jgi:lipopolysaccharide assembly outer membrane protein LptD (OstA)
MLRVLLLFLAVVSPLLKAKAQDIPPSNTVQVRSNQVTDSVAPTNPPARVQLDSLLMDQVAVEQDSVRSDSIEPPAEFLTDIVEYYGEDYVYLDRKTNQVFLYNEAWVTYQDMRIDAGLIIIDYNKNEVYAKGIDSSGAYAQSPLFVQGGNKVEPDSIRFNFDTKRALVYNSYTEQNGFNVISEVTKKENDSVYFLSKVKFTTSENIDDPEYYFYTRKAKFVPGKKVVTGLTNMYIADVPTPVGLPFAFFPLTEDRASGVVIPNIGDNPNRGFFFQNGGYYFAINDYVDLTVLGDYYTNGSYGLRLESAYALRYKFRGNLSFRLEKLINSERGFPDFSESSLYNIRWNHNQDAKANPSSRFAASVNLGSSRYFAQSINQTNNASALVNTLSSSISYSKTFDTQPEVNVTVAATHTQNTNTEQIDMSLPNLNATMARIFPFAPKSGSKKGVLQNVNLQYDLSAQNQITTTDSLFFKPEMFENARFGARHNIPISTNFKVLNYLSASMGVGYQETWVGKTIRRSYDPNANEGQGEVVQDTVAGFDAYRTYNFNASLGTTVYGTFNFGQGKRIEAIRHVMRPSISYSIRPSFDQFYDEYTVPSADPEVADQVISYSRFEGSLFGAPSQNRSSSIGFNLSNTIEAKVRDRDTTATEPKKINLLNNLNLSTFYDIAADSLRLSPLRITGSIPIVEKLDFNFNGSLDIYALDNNNRRINTLNIDNGGSLFRLTQGNISINYSFSSRDFEGGKSEDQQREEGFNSETFRNGGRPDDLFGDATPINAGRFDPVDQGADRGPINNSWYRNPIPWNFRLAYTMTYSNSQRQNEISSQSLMFSSNVELSPRWSVGISSGYDFKNKGVTLTNLRFQRDLESWQMSFNWTPIGAVNTSWYFYIGIKSNVLSDIKYENRREPDRQL